MNGSVVDLRSDTVTRPTAAMREAIARAEVGDDYYGEDPTVVRLQQRTAELVGKEAALFFPSGIMANETALLVLGRPGTEVIVEATAHFVDWELGAPAALGGAQLRPVQAPDSMLTPDLVEAAIRPFSRLQIQTSMVCLENTHNAAGGRVFPLPLMRQVSKIARRHQLPVHLDGARLWNATAATGIPEADYAACADTVMVTLSKGLGCPVGSLLAGDARTIDQARTVRRRLGGGMRQAGVLAAAGLYALEHHRARLHEDHARAALLANLVTDIPGLRAIPPETNIVMFEIERPDLDASTLVNALEHHGVRMVEFTRRRVRAVTHLDVTDDDVRAAAQVLLRVLD